MPKNLTPAVRECFINSSKRKSQELFAIGTARSRKLTWSELLLTDIYKCGSKFTRHSSKTSSICYPKAFTSELLRRQWKLEVSRLQKKIWWQVITKVSNIPPYSKWETQQMFLSQWLDWKVLVKWWTILSIFVRNVLCWSREKTRVMCKGRKVCK